MIYRFSSHNFVYSFKGEVRINEDQLNSFLHTAKSLGIRGLMGDGKKGDTENGTNKRKRRLSVEVSSDQEEVNSLATPPPPPPLLKHKANLTKTQNIEVKCELPMDQDSRFEETVNSLHPENESLTQNSSIHSGGQELEDDELDLFQHCGAATAGNHHHHPGPSRLSAEELHSSGQGKLQATMRKVFFLGTIR